MNFRNIMKDHDPLRPVYTRSRYAHARAMLIMAAGLTIFWGVVLYLVW